MGIIKAFTGATGGVLADQWLEMYYCDSIPQEILAQKGFKRVNPNSANTKGSEDVISNGSIIVVNEAQCALVIEQGKVIEMHDQPGEHVFHSGRSTSIFSGGGVKELGKSIIDRVGYGGDVAIHQFVVYLDMKEHMNIPFSVTCPVNVTDEETGFEMTATVQMGGVFSFRITDPLTFYKVVCFNRAGTVTLTSVLPQLQAEFATAVMEAVAKACGVGVASWMLPEKTEAIAAAVKECMTEKWVSLRGFSVVSMAINAFRLFDQDMKRIQTFERDKMLRDPQMAAATLTAAQADAMQSAARNPGGSAGFAAIGAVSAPTAGREASKPALWYCPNCKRFRTGNFCPDCGAKKPD